MVLLVMSIHIYHRKMFFHVSLSQANTKAEIFLPDVNARIKLSEKFQQVFFINV